MSTRTGRTVVLVLLGIIFLGSTTAAEAKRVALVVGNNDYQKVGDLEKAVNDARAIGDTLKDLGFTVVAAYNVTRREMNEKVLELTTQITPGDEAVFFYAGHGVQIQGENFLLPTDIPAALPGEEDFVKAEAVRVDEVVSNIRGRGARVTIIILDACRNNPFPNDGLRLLGGQTGLVRTPAPPGTFVMYSAGDRQEALDGLTASDRNQNSVYTRELIPLMKAPGLRLIEIVRQVRDQVEKLALTVGQEQRPAYVDNFSGDFYFTPKESGTSRTAQEEALWENVKRSNKLSSYEFYLKRFPQGRYAEVAQLRINELREQQLVIGSRAGAPEQRAIKRDPRAEEIRRVQAAEVQRREDARRAREAAAEKAEEERIAQEAEAKRAEEERIAREEERQAQEAAAKRAEEARIAREAEAQRREAERQAQEAAAKRAEEARIAREAEAQRREAERQEREAAAKAEAERLEREAEAKRREAERQARQAAAAKAEQERIAREAEAERREEERRAQEAAAKRAEEERIAREAAERRREEERQAREAAARRAEEERIVREAAERRREEERQAQEAAAKRAEEERIAREAEDQRREAERQAQEAAAKQAEEERAAREAEAQRQASTETGATGASERSENDPTVVARLSPELAPPQSAPPSEVFGLEERAKFVRQIQAELKERRCYAGDVNGEPDDGEDAVTALSEALRDEGRDYRQIELKTASRNGFEAWLQWLLQDLKSFRCERKQPEAEPRREREERVRPRRERRERATPPRREQRRTSPPARRKPSGGGGGMSPRDFLKGTR